MEPVRMARTTAGRTLRRRIAATAHVHATPPFRPVQLAKLVDSVPSGNRWLHELKYDGYRVQLAVGGGQAAAYTRSGLDWSERFADGEAVVLDADGRPSFQALQNALKGAPERIDYFAFDLLELDGADLTSLPLTDRKAKLARIVPKS
jgi:bifunctional non-homologous end joining protein LigD